MTPRRTVFRLALLLLVLAAAPVHVLAQDAPKPINTMCPVLPDEEVVPRYTLEYRGRTIGFCCRKCLAKFEREPETFVGNLPDVFADAPAPVADLGDAPGDDDHEGAEAGGLEALFARSHVLVLHFPIALLVAGALAELLALARKSRSLTAAAHYCANLALPFAVWTYYSGHELEHVVKLAPSMHDMLERHEQLGLITAWSVVTVCVLGWIARRQAAPAAASLVWRLALFAAAVLVGVTAHAGGQLVHGLGYPFV